MAQAPQSFSSQTLSIPVKVSIAQRLCSPSESLAFSTSRWGAFRYAKTMSSSGMAGVSMPRPETAKVVLRRTTPLGQEHPKANDTGFVFPSHLEIRANCGER